MVFLGLNISESLVTRGSGTSTTAVWTSNRPADAVVGVFPRVKALKIVVFPDWGNPMIPSFILSLFCVLNHRDTESQSSLNSQREASASLWLVISSERQRFYLTFILGVVYFGAHGARHPSSRSGGIGRRARLKIVFPPGM